MLWVCAASVTLAAPPELFVLDNGVGSGAWTPAQQAVTLKELGFDGISYNYTTAADLAVRVQAFKEHGLKIYALYLPIFLGSTDRYNPAIDDAARILRGTDTVLWVTSQAFKDKANHDAELVPLIRQIADVAQANGLRVALYGHVNLYIETAEDTLRIARQVARPSVGATLNLCHEFFSKKGDQLDATITHTAGQLMLVSVNGVDTEKGDFILRLDRGNFDVAAFLKNLRSAGYRGPVGLQCYGVAGDVKENLRANIAAWRKIAPVLD